MKIVKVDYTYTSFSEEKVKGRIKHHVHLGAATDYIEVDVIPGFDKRAEYFADILKRKHDLASVKITRLRTNNDTHNTE